MDTTRLDTGLFRSVAPNGLTVLTEMLPGVRSAAVGVWVRTASAHEPRTLMGVSHLLEHMVFKGSERRTARQIAMELEVRGGSLDAYTGRDYTSFQAHVVDEDVPRAVDVLTDLVRRPLLREQDLQLERNVVLEEINMVADTPDDLVFDLLASRMWPTHGYGHSILGTPDTVGSLTAEDLRNLHGGNYYPGNCVIAAAGSINHERLLELLEREGWLAGGAAREPTPPVIPEAALRGANHRETRDTAQSHIVIATDTFPYRDPRRFALAILVNTFGGGMSSRLFQKVREELGLAYAIYAYQSLHCANGVSGVYVGTHPGTADRATEAILAEYETLARIALSEAELAEGKQQLKGQVLLSLESPAARMSRLATVALHGEPYRNLDELRATIDAVTLDEVREVAALYFAPERQTLMRLGPDLTPPVISMN